MPWVVSTQEIKSCLVNQGIQVRSVQKVKKLVRVQVPNMSDFHRLLGEGLNFCKCRSFTAIPESGNKANGETDVVQCYKCQGFWHTTKTCRQPQRYHILVCTRWLSILVLMSVDVWGVVRIITSSIVQDNVTRPCVVTVMVHIMPLTGYVPHGFRWIIPHTLGCSFARESQIIIIIIINNGKTSVWCSNQILIWHDVLQ